MFLYLRRLGLCKRTLRNPQKLYFSKICVGETIARVENILTPLTDFAKRKKEKTQHYHIKTQ